MIKKKKLKIMEVCGTHTMAIAKYGLRNYFHNVDLVSGPGCPVCVTPSNRLEECINLLKKNKNKFILTTFGDLIRVPSITSSLEKEIKNNADVRVVYSVYESLEIAQKNKDKEVIFLGAGFETTAPMGAFLIKEARKKKIKNLTLFSMFKSVFPVLEVLCNSKEIEIDGFILPGNVAAITGFDDFSFISKKFKIPSVIAGFSDKEIKDAIKILKQNIYAEKPFLENKYKSVVGKKGNLKAKKIMKDVFNLKDVNWRGIGKIKNSGFILKDKYKEFDADKKFKIKQVKAVKDNCICGNILKGIKTPLDCKMFGKKCVPENPVGPCMVSSEGVCAAYFKYGKNNG